MRRTLCILFLFSGFCLQSQIISTVAGIGTLGYTGDGGNALNCQLNHPFSIILDKGGNVFIADEQNHCVRKIDSAGTIRTVAGTGSNGYSGDNGLATLAQLSEPVSLAFDTSGNLYIADWGSNNTIRKVDQSGIITTVAGTGVAGFNGDNIAATLAKLNAPAGIAFDRQNNLYVADEHNQRIRKINSSGIITTVAGTGTSGFGGDAGAATSATISNPAGICFDKIGNLLIADVSNNRIRKVDTSGIMTTVAGNGTVGYNGDNGQATLAQLDGAAYVVADQAGNFFISDQFNSVIRKVDASGVISTIVGSGVSGYSGDGGSAILAQIYYPEGITLDDTGHLYIADNFNYRIRKVTNVGTMSIKQNESQTNDIFLFPNPSNGDFFVRNDYTARLIVDVYTGLGSLVYSQEIKSGNAKVLGSESLNKGIYLVKIKSGTSLLKIEKIIVSE